MVKWSALEGGECSASCPSYFTTWIKHPPRDSLNTLDDIKISCPCWDTIPRFSTCSLVTTIIRLFQLQHCPVRSTHYKAPKYASVTILPQLPVAYVQILSSAWFSNLPTRFPQNKRPCFQTKLV